MNPRPDDAPDLAATLPYRRSEMSTDPQSKIPRTMTRGEYLQLHGLAVLARRYSRQLDEASNEIARLLGEDRQSGPGHYWDVAHGERDVDDALRVLNITVQPEGT